MMPVTFSATLRTSRFALTRFASFAGRSAAERPDAPAARRARRSTSGMPSRRARYRLLARHQARKIERFVGPLVRGVGALDVAELALPAVVADLVHGRRASTRLRAVRAPGVDLAGRPRRTRSGRSRSTSRTCGSRGRFRKYAGARARDRAVRSSADRSGRTRGDARGRARCGFPFFKPRAERAASANARDPLALIAFQPSSLSALSKRPAWLFSAFASVSNHSATSAKPSSRAVLAKPGYIVWYS